MPTSDAATVRIIDDAGLREISTFKCGRCNRSVPVLHEKLMPVVQKLGQADVKELRLAALTSILLKRVDTPN